MNPFTAQLLMFAVEEALKYGPKAVADVIAIFKKKDATLADLIATFDDVKPYESWNLPETAPTLAKVVGQ